MLCLKNKLLFSLLTLVTYSIFIVFTLLLRYVCVMLLKKKTFICIELAMFYKLLINENISCVRKK